MNFGHFLGPDSPLTFHNVKTDGGAAKRDGHREFEERSTLASDVDQRNVVEHHSWVKIVGFRDQVLGFRV